MLRVEGTPTRLGQPDECLCPAILGGIDCPQTQAHCHLRGNRDDATLHSSSYSLAMSGILVTNLALFGICGAAWKAARRWHRRFLNRGKCPIMGMGLFGKYRFRQEATIQRASKFAQSKSVCRHQCSIRRSILSSGKCPIMGMECSTRLPAQPLLWRFVS